MSVTVMDSFVSVSYKAEISAYFKASAALKLRFFLKY